MNKDDAYPSTPNRWRLATAAMRAGMSPDLFASACERGDIPVALERIGVRGLRFVNTAEFLEWERGRAAKPIADLFHR